MKIKIIENVTIVREVMEEGVSRLEEVTKQTGRSWDIEIPIEPVQLKEVWRGIRGDIRELIHLAKNCLR